MIFALAGFALILFEAARGVSYPRWVYPAAITVMLAVLGAAWLFRESVKSGLRDRGTAERTTGQRPPALSWTIVQLLVFSALLSWYGMRNVLGIYEISGRLAPQDAPDILVAGGALSAFLTAISLAVSRVLRADGAQRHASGQGAQAEHEGRAQEIRAEYEGRAAQTKAEYEGQAAVTKAEYEGQAAVARADAARRRAEAEYLRAEKGIDPLPVQGPDSSGPPAIGPAPGPNGAPGSAPPALPSGSDDAETP